RIAAVVPQLQGAVGRMQRVPSNEGCFIVDYAHTPDALQQVLASLKTHCDGQLWAVFGCGGDRDAGKRPLMAQAGLAGADQIILTADNPRTEDPNMILQDMQAGMSAEQYQRTHIEPARQKAIEYAVQQAAVDDIVVIAGKGHETYQEINNVRYDFDDSVVLQNALQQAGRA
ncbi:MAG: cyanophycin synthetase, partial [Psychrobacter alimentarius]